MVAQAARQYEGKVAFVGMGSRDGLGRLADFVDEHGLSGFPQVADESGALRARLGVVGQPTWLFIGADGTVEKVFGELGREGLTKHLDALVAK